MGLAIGRIVELVGVEGAIGLAGVQLLGEPTREVDEMIGTGEGRRIHLNQARAMHAHRLFLFLRLAARHDDEDGMPQGGADDGQADPGIACRSFDDSAPGPERA